MKEIENALQCPEICQRLREIFNLNWHNALLPVLPGPCMFGDSRLQWMLLAGAAVKPEQPGSAELRVLTHPRDDLQKELWVNYNGCFPTCTNSQFSSMCNEEYEAVQPGHLGLDETILCILGGLENFLTDYEIISWPEIHFWAHSVGRQMLFPHNLWLELDRKAGGFNP